MDKKDNKAKYHKVVQNNFNAPIYHYYEYIENYNGNHEADPKQEDIPKVPSTEEMIQAVKATFSQGLWWSNRSWAVVYRVWQMKGYFGSISDFVREVEGWKLKSDHDCSYDAVQKPIASGILSGMPERWKEQGAQGQAVKLALALLAELDHPEDV